MPQNANREADSGECLARSAFRRAKRVYAKHKGASDRLLAQRSAFSAGSRQNDFFTRAVLECFACHFLHNPAYRRLCLHQNIRPGDIRKYADLGCLPYITVKAENGHLQNILTTAAASSVKLYCRQTRQTVKPQTSPWMPVRCAVCAAPPTIWAEPTACTPEKTSIIYF